MSEETPTELCTCELVSDPAHLPAARLFAGSVARGWGAAERVISDVRLGVSELVAASIRGGTDRVLITMERRRDQLRLTVAPLDEQAMEEGEEPAADIVAALFDRVEYDHGGVSLRVDRRA